MGPSSDRKSVEMTRACYFSHAAKFSPGRACCVCFFYNANIQPSGLDIVESECENTYIRHHPMDQEFLRPPESWSRAVSRQERSGSGPLSSCTVARDGAAIITDLNEQINGAKHQIRDLEKILDSNCNAAEKIVSSLLRERHHLREALKRSEMRVENEARKLRQASRTAQLLFDVLCENRADLKCEIKCHKEMGEALEESLKATAEAIQKEAERDQEVSALREELRIVTNSVSDQRNISRIVSQQVESLERLVTIQHNEIKHHKSEIEDLKQVNKILTEENDRLHVDSSSIQKASIGTQTDYYSDKTSSAVVRRLEEQIIISRKQTQKLLAEVQHKGGQQAELEKNYSSERHQATSQTIHEYQRNERMAKTDQQPAARVAQLYTNDKRTSDNPNVGHQYLGSIGSRLMAAQYKPMEAQTREFRERQEIQEAETMQNIRREEQMAQFRMNMSRQHHPFRRGVPEPPPAILSMQRIENRLRESIMARRGRPRLSRFPTNPRPSPAGENTQGAASGDGDGDGDAGGEDNGEHAVCMMVPLDDPIYDAFNNDNGYNNNNN